MRAHLFVALCLCAPALARAEGPAVGLAPRAAATGYHASGSTLSFGGGASFDDAWNVEARLAPWGGYAEALGGRGWSLRRDRLFAARLRVDGSLIVPYVGPRDLGAGAWLTATGGLGGERFELFLGAQGGLEAFVNPLEARFPVRLLLGLRGRLGPVELQLFARGGVDGQPRAPLAYRGELGLAIGYVLAPR